MKQFWAVAALVWLVLSALSAIAGDHLLTTIQAGFAMVAFGFGQDPTR